jgi:sulfite reductase beta subunit-like hemoprotein
LPDIEKIKREGVSLNLAEVAHDGYAGVKPDDHYRLKTLGVCGQRNAVGETYFFLRIKVPFGQVRPAQLIALASLAQKYGRGWGHLTTRQGIELHSVSLEDVPVIFAQLEQVGLTTKASCGDTIRNVVTCAHVGDTPSNQPASIHSSDPLFDVRPWALLVQNHFLELGPENLNLPRKMNVYMTGCANCIGHARINDLGLVATTRRQADGTYEQGFALWVGGGLGANPRLAHQLRSFLAFDEVLPALEAVVRLYMAHGSRRSRATAKLKFLIEEWGMGRFNSEFESYYREVLPRFQSMPLPSRRSLPLIQMSKTNASAKRQASASLKNNHTKAFALNTSYNASNAKNNQNTKTYTVSTHEVNVYVEGGEITSHQLQTLADLVGLFGEGFAYFTKEQNICFKNLDWDEAAKLKEALQVAGFQVEGAARIDDVVACPGTAFCQIGVTPSLTTAHNIHQELHKRIVAGELPPALYSLRIQISGCPNSCAQHQTADIGLSGTRVHTADPTKSVGGYQLFLGGSLESTGRLGLLVHPGIPEAEVTEIILKVLHAYSQEQHSGESFSAYVHRIGQDVWEQRLSYSFSQR